MSSVRRLEANQRFNRNPQVVLAYPRLRAIVRRARHMQDPTRFSMEAGDEEEHPFETLARDVAKAEQRVRHEERIEADRRVAEARIDALNEAHIDMEQRVAVELERRVAAELERRVADGGLEAE